MTERNLLVIQGGGPTQVLNATLAAIVSEARASEAFDRVLGARWGMKGLAEGHVADLNCLSAAQLARLRGTPGAVLGSSRFKLADEDMASALEHLQRMHVHDLLVIGGNGTMRGAAVIEAFCRNSGYDVRVLGIPKTVDNDIAVTDRCPGYASAARYVAQSTRDLGMDVRSLPQPVSILETMGRSVGWLAAASAAGKRDEQDAPHLVYLPERPFVIQDFLARLDDLVARQGWAIVAVSEGICYGNGQLVYQVEDPTQSDALRRPLTGGVAQYLAGTVAKHLKVRCRSEKPGLLGRSSMLHVAQQDVADAEQVGRAGVQGLLAGETGKMVSLLPLRGTSQPNYKLVALHDVAGIERPMPAEWLGDGAIPVNESFFDYLRPLIGDLLPCSEPLPWDESSRGDA